VNRRKIHPAASRFFGICCVTPALLALAGVATFAADSPVASIVLAAGGRAEAEIVVTSSSPEPPLEFAAHELQRYIKEISGAELPLLKQASGGPAVILISKPFGRGPDPLEEDHYRLNVSPGKLLIQGATPRAALFGVYDLLERLGCGWCVPGEDIIPRRETLQVTKLAVDTRPAFQYRMMLDFPLMTIRQSVAICDWIAKNRMNWVHPCPNAHGEPKTWYERRERIVPELRKRGLHLILGGHTMHTWVPETNFATHPEWFAYAAGERKAPTLCISNPEMSSELIRNIRSFLDRCPEVEVVDLWHTDNEIFCHCPKCTRDVVTTSTKENPNGSASSDAVQSAYVTSFMEFINRVAEALGKSHPRVMLSPLIYSQTDRAMPDKSPAPRENVLMGLAHFQRDSYCPLAGEPKSAVNLRLLGDDLTWIAKSKHFYIYEYFNSWVAPFIYPGAQVITADLQTMHNLHFQGASSDMYGYSPINMYVAARSLWSPTTDWRSTVREFCLRYYGDVGEQMAENEITLNREIFGRNGYQASGARDPEKWPIPPGAGLYLAKKRTQQIQFLREMRQRTKTPEIRPRLDRALKPWTDWNKDPRFWAFPEFSDSL
jgi:hypothetical protein